jgi:hypothetical protein
MLALPEDFISVRQKNLPTNSLKMRALRWKRGPWLAVRPNFFQ